MVQRILVSDLATFQTITFGVEDVTVEGEAEAGVFRFLPHFGTEAIHRNFFIGVIILKDVSNCSQRLEIFVLGLVFDIVQGTVIPLVPV